MFNEGDIAPDFELTDDSGNQVKLSKMLETGPVLLYFYPADFTPVCTKQACMFRDIYANMRAAGVHVLGVSPQDPASHARFRKEHALPFPLLADPDKSVIRIYGANGPLGIGVRRVSYLIAPDRTIQQVVLADFRVSKHEELAQSATRRS
ncbi:MAG: peroxiredoxin [Candidatus Wallbacteria bacterium]|nr:peroxiredoxin [Candidatus Wallbacteria bacterium]